jgi:YggT family protein
MSVLYTFITLLARILSLAIIVRVLLSWIPLDRDNRTVAALYRLIYGLTEPILGPIRRVLPSLGGLDLAPMLGLLLIEILQRVVVTLLVRLS